MALPRLHGSHIGSRTTPNPAQELTHGRTNGLRRQKGPTPAAHYIPGMTKGLARSLAARCGELRDSGLDAAAAERLTFDEFLHDHTTAAASAQPNVYEAFLKAFAPEQQRAHGVYYTPAPVVAAQVRLAADVLEHGLGCPTAFGDERVLIIDPATGSGAYPLAVVTHTLERRPTGGDRSLRRRMRLFEPLPGAARLARAHGLEVEECDVLTAPIALDGQIVVCLSNPPYRRTQRQALPVDLAKDIPVKGTSVHLKNTYNAYVYFWRWAIRALFEQRRGPGLVSFVSASSYLRGPGFAGLRQLLRLALDELWIVDLEGDHLAARPTDNVFPIRTPVAIAMGVRYAGARPNEQAEVHYARLTGSRVCKLAQLDRLRRVSDLSWQATPRQQHTPLVPRPSGAYQTWPTLTELFPWQVSGAQVKRTWPIAPSPELLTARWAQLLSVSGAERNAALGVTRDRDLDSTPCDLREPTRRLAPLRCLPADRECVEPVGYAYRSFDRQWVIPDARLGDFMRPRLWQVLGPRQVFLTSLLTNVLGPGPAAVATALVPDLDHFRGSFGARAVIPLWLDAGANLPNVAQHWLDRLAQRYGFTVDAEKLLGYCYALLGTRGYVNRFEEELRTPGPRLPFPRDGTLFTRAALLGTELLRLHTLRARAASAGVARCTEPPGCRCPCLFDYDPTQQILQIGDGWFAPVASAVWDYSVSGMRILPSWLRRRVSPTRTPKSPLDAITLRAWSPSLTRELLELIWVLEATLALEPALDAVLDEIVSEATMEA